MLFSPHQAFPAAHFPSRYGILIENGMSGWPCFGEAGGNGKVAHAQLLVMECPKGWAKSFTVDDLSLSIGQGMVAA